MIKYNNSNINDWNYGTSDIIKVYRNNAVCYYKIVTSGDTPTQVPCYAVVNDISQYSDTEFVDVYNKADEKWYKLNNLNQYEEYGVYGSGRTITYYQGKLTIDDGYEYQYSGSSWVNVGEVSGSTIETVWLDYPSTNNFNANFDIGHYWGEGYKMVFNTYLSGSYSRDRGSFWRYGEHTPIEFSFYSNGFYYDMHNPTSTSAPNVITSDYSYRIMKSSSFSNYENGQIMNITLTYGTIKAELEETGAVIMTGSTSVSSQNWYSGLYQASIGTMNNYNRCHLSSIKVYNANDELVNDLKFVKNQGVTGSQEISLYDSVLNVTYNNTNSYTPVYHIVSESGGTEYPLYYDEIQDPPNNLVFSSMAEAEAYECPWVGMQATIDGVKYIFSGDSQSGYEWVEKPSRLPQGYTEVEYIEQTSQNVHTFADTAFTIPLNSVFGDIVSTKISLDSSQNNVSRYITIFGSQLGLALRQDSGYRYNLNTSYAGKYNYSNSYTMVYDTPLIYKVSPSNIKITNTVTSQEETITFNGTSNTAQTQTSSAIFGLNFTDSGSYMALGKCYWFKLEDSNGNIKYEYIPCIRDNDNKVGMYDIINSQFVYSTYLTLVAGPSV